MLLAPFTLWLRRSYSSLKHDDENCCSLSDFPHIISIYKFHLLQNVSSFNSFTKAAVISSSAYRDSSTVCLPKFSTVELIKLCEYWYYGLGCSFFFSRNMIPISNLLQNWQGISFHVFCIMKIAQQWTTNQGQVLYLTCKCLWQSSKFSTITTDLQHFKVRGTVGLVNPVIHKCWKITKLSPLT